MQTSQAGMELRMSRQSYPRYRYALGFDLRSSAAYAEFQALAGFLARHMGAWDSFLFTDPDDCTASYQTFGLGTGAATSYQLQRTLAPRNLQPQSSRFDLWTGNNAVTVTPAADLAPDGTLTAQLLTFGASAYVVQSANGAGQFACAVVPGQTVTVSIWLRSRLGPQSVVLNVEGVGLLWGPIIASLNCTATAAWQRFSCTGVVPAGVDVASIYLSAASGVSVLAWGAQVEVAAAAGPNIPTGAIAPTLWPTTGDGYEPVSDLAGPPTIYLDDMLNNAQVLSPAQRTNLIPYSEPLLAQLSSYSAGVTQGSLSTVIGLSNGVTFPAVAELDDGIFTLTLAAGTTYAISAYVQMADGSAPRVASVAGGTANDDLAMVLNNAVCTSGIVVTPVGRGQALYRVQATAVGNGSPLAAGVFRYAVQSGKGFTVTGFQVEAVDPSNAIAGQYIKTTGAAASLTDYGLSSTGGVMMGQAPSNGAVLRWSGSYYRRVRFDGDDLDMHRLFNGLWEAKQVRLVSVKSL